MIPKFFTIPKIVINIEEESDLDISEYQSRRSRNSSFLSITSSHYNADDERNSTFDSDFGSSQSLCPSTKSLCPSQSDSSETNWSNKQLIEQRFHRRQGVMFKNVISRRRRTVSENDKNRKIPEWVKTARNRKISGDVRIILRLRKPYTITKISHNF